MANQVDAILHTFFDEDVDAGSGVDGALIAKFAQAITYLQQNAQDALGTVLLSALTESQFASVKNYSLTDSGGSPISEASKKWVLMKGQSVAGSDFQSLTGKSSLPNMVGTSSFVRQATSSGNIFGYQSDTYPSHRHYTIVNQRRWFSALSTGNSLVKHLNDDENYFDERRQGYFLSGDSQEPNVSRTSVQGNGSETRPKNIQLNYFIKINN